MNSFKFLNLENVIFAILIGEFMQLKYYSVYIVILSVQFINLSFYIVITCN